ncbi:MAG: hypothetical protein KF851_18245 [Pirellulaceae bacterium]|nr:hypothetical protein [Pirellulaceae bacterium]
MPKWALVFGALLVGLGLLGYFGGENKPGDANSASIEKSVVGENGNTEVSSDSGAKRGTALIPAAFGMLLVICGTLGTLPDLRKHAMHVAAAVALLGFLASFGRLAMGIGKLLEGDFSRATLFLMGMAALCGAYVFLSIQSFRQARKARQGESVQ